MTLRNRLTALVAAPQTQTLVRFAPLALVSTIAGASIGAALAAPAFAAAGLGAVLVGLGTNLVSSMIYDIVKPGSDDETRALVIQQGLEQHDPQVVALVADTLAVAGPELAGALPAERTALVAALERGMREGGGALEAIAQQLGTALRNPQADWNAVQRSLSTTIASISMSMETSDEAQMKNNVQNSAATGGPVTMDMKAGGKSVMEGNQQIVGVSPAQPAHQGQVAPRDIKHQRELLAATIARLQIRELQAAHYGIDAPPHILAERDELRTRVEQMRRLWATGQE